MTSDEQLKLPMAPNEIKVPDKNPFENDELDRQQFVETLGNIIGRVASPCVIAIDGQWGAGKTTLLKMSAAQLRKENYHVVSFNAWETDFTSSPFQALSAEISSSLGGDSTPGGPELVDKLKKAAVPVIMGLAKLGANLIVPGVGTILDTAQGAMDTSGKPDPVSEYLELKQQIVGFHDTLKQAATEIASAHEGHPLIVAIDELDRCRPSYAIELLEVAKHVFMTPNIIFVLAINSGELEESIRSLYGSGFDSERYLRRFINLPIKIPSENLSGFTEAKFNAVGLVSGPDRSAPLHVTPYAMLQSFFGHARQSPRDIEQGIYHINLTRFLAPNMSPPWQTCMAVAFILRLSNPPLFSDLAQGVVSETAILESVFGNLPIDADPLRGIKPFIESAIIAGTARRFEADRTHLMFVNQVEMSPLANTSSAYAKHVEIMAGIDGIDLSTLDRIEANTKRAQRRYSATVLQSANQALLDLWTGDEPPALVEAAYLMSLLSK